MLEPADITELTYNIAGQLDVKLKPIREQLDGLHLDHEILVGRFDNLEARFDTLETKVDQILERLAA